MSRLFRILIIPVLLILSSTTMAQQEGKLVINPKLLGGLGRGIPVTHFPNGHWVRRDEHSGSYIIPKLPPRKSKRPEELLIIGTVPDIHKRWAIVLTHDEAELYQKLIEYRDLKSRGKINSPRNNLYVKNLSVATKVTSFFGDVKVKDMPEKAGSFFLTVRPGEIDEHGNLITFLSYTPLEGGDIVDVGDDFGEEINGMLLITETTRQEDSALVYKMEVIKAKLTDESLKEQTYIVEKSHD